MKVMRKKENSKIRKNLTLKKRNINSSTFIKPPCLHNYLLQNSITQKKNNLYMSL